MTNITNNRVIIDIVMWATYSSQNYALKQQGNGISVISIMIISVSTSRFALHKNDIALILSTIKMNRLHVLHGKL